LDQPIQPVIERSKTGAASKPRGLDFGANRRLARTVLGVERHVAQCDSRKYADFGG
jgi:hypothetical protein